MRAYLVAIALLLFGPSAFAQPVSQPSTANPELLSMDQKVIVGSIITEKTPPLTNTQFSPVVSQAVPPQIQIQTLPPEAEQLAPQLHGYGCIVFEELIAIVDLDTRRIAMVIPRWHQQDNPNRSHAE
jgi:hypothetical protein